MSDDRYLDGDPTEERILYEDLTPFVQTTQQDCRLIVELILAGRHEDAYECALGRQLRAESLLKYLEAERLPEVDIERSSDVATPNGRVYKSA